MAVPHSNPSISIQIKHFLKKLGLFLLLLIILDMGIGYLFHKAFFSQPSGKFHRMNWTVDHTEDQLMIFGSSHATRHYDPLVLEKASGTTCYNSGVQGRGILFIRAIQKMMLSRHQPKTILLNIDPQMLLARQDNYDRLSDLLPYYKDHPEVRPILNLRSDLEKYKLLSNLYAYNSTIVHIIKYQLIKQHDQKGYRPHEDSINPQTYQKLAHRNRAKKSFTHLDSNNINALTNFLIDAKEVNTKVIAVVSPTYFGETYEEDKSFIQILEVLKKQDIKLWNYSNSDNYIGKASLFYDEHHLNKNGAEIFSKEIGDRLKNNYEGSR